MSGTFNDLFLDHTYANSIGQIALRIYIDKQFPNEKGLPISLPEGLKSY